VGGGARLRHLASGAGHGHPEPDHRLFYDRGAHFQLDDLLRRAEQLIADGADLLDVGARAAGVGTREVSEAEETDLLTECVTELRRRLDVPLSVDTWRAPVAAAAFAAGAVVGNDLSGFSDPEFLPAAAAAGATVVATHMRLAPSGGGPGAGLRRRGRRRGRGPGPAGRLRGVGRDRIRPCPGRSRAGPWQDLAAVDPATGRLHSRGRHGARVLRVQDARPVRQAADLLAAVLALDAATP